MSLTDKQILAYKDKLYFFFKFKLHCKTVEVEFHSDSYTPFFRVYLVDFLNNYQEFVYSILDLDILFKRLHIKEVV